MSVEASLMMGLVVIFMTSWILLLHLQHIQVRTQQALDQAVMGLADRISMQERLGQAGKKVEAFLTQKGPKLKDLAPLNPADQQLLQQSSRTWIASLLFERALAGKQGLSRSITAWCGPFRLQASMEEDENLLSLTLSYDLRLPGPLSFLGPKEVIQNTKTGLWLLTDSDLSGRIAEGEKDKKRASSIWQESNFSRGKKFVAKYKGERSHSIAPGQGIDFINERGEAVELYSLNLFSASYTQGSGQEASGYQLKEQAVEKKLAFYLTGLLQHLAEQGPLKGENGQNLARPQQGRLLIILPEEASYFAPSLEQIARKLGQEKGIPIEFRYDQKRWVEEKDEKIQHP